MGTTSVNRRGPPSLPRAEPGLHGLNRWTVKCRDLLRKRGIPTDKTPPARTEVLSARGAKSKPVAMRGQAGDHQKRQGHPLAGAGKRGWPPNVIRAWGVTTLSANLAGDDSWVAGIELATASEPPVIRAWGVTTLSANLAGDDSWVAGIELATASEPPARRPRIWGRCPSGVDPSHP